uniref:Uncharacterized protein n=1 Tax=Anopheles dirus TaxID=7168 RepID=A0A182NFF5_9DIPT
MFVLHGCRTYLIATLALSWLYLPSTGAGGVSDERFQLGATDDNSTVVLERAKRLINFPINGGVAKVLLGFLSPVRFHHPLPRSLNLGINLQANYAISPNIIFPHPESIFKNRNLAGYSDPHSRQRVYATLERWLKMALGTGRRARGCLLRTVCEVADTPLHHNGLVGELLDVIFTPQESDALSPKFLMARRYGANGVDCMRLYSACPLGMGLLDYVSRVLVK